MHDRRRHGWKKMWVVFWSAILLSCIPANLNAAPRKHPPLTNITVLVTEAKTDQPIFQARLTLQFRDPDSRRGKMISYSAKTDIHGKYKFTFIPMDKVLLVVTAPQHQTFGKEFQITEQGQVIHVKLKKPQPLR